MSVITQIALWLTATFMVLSAPELGPMAPLVLAFAIFLIFYLIAHQVLSLSFKLYQHIKLKRQAI